MSVPINLDLRPRKHPGRHSENSKKKSKQFMCHMFCLGIRNRRTVEMNWQWEGRKGRASVQPHRVGGQSKPWSCPRSYQG